MFPLVFGFWVRKNIIKFQVLLKATWENCRTKFNGNFLSLKIQVYEWVRRDPFSEFPIQPENFTLKDKEELTQVQYDVPSEDLVICP